MEGFEPGDGELVVDKAAFNAFHESPLAQHLADRAMTHLIVTGVTTQCCVHSTLRDAVDRGFICLTVEDCCAAFQREWHDATMQIIQSESNLFGWIASSREVEAALAGG
jgi:nicotinamidase-related amidase